MRNLLRDPRAPREPAASLSEPAILHAEPVGLQVWQAKLLAYPASRQDRAASCAFGATKLLAALAMEAQLELGCVALFKRNLLRIRRSSIE